MKDFLKSHVRDILSSLPAGAALSDYLIRREHPVFMFHRILPAGEPCYADEMTATPKVLDEFLTWLRQHYEIVPLPELSRVAPKASPRPRPLCGITFDDGWQDNYEHAFPVLRKHQVPVTIFLATGFIGTSRRLWQDRLWRSLEVGSGKFDPAEVAAKLWGRFPWCPVLRAGDITVAGLRRILMRCNNQDAEAFVSSLEELTGQAFAADERGFLTWSEVAEMEKGGIEFGSHTHNHTLLTTVSPAHSSEEILQSKRALESHLDRSVRSFSYPWGRTIGHITRQVEQAGFECAVTAEISYRNGVANPYLISRIPVSGPVLTRGSDRFEPAKARVSFALSQMRAKGGRSAAPHPSGTRERLRIALVIDTIDSWNGGGTEGHIRHLLHALDSEYFEPELFLLDPTPVDHSRIPCPVRVVPPGSGPRPLRAISVLRREMKRFKPHVVQTFFPDATFFGTIAAKLAGVPIIVHAERNLGHEVNGRDRILRGWLRKQVDAFQCNSRAIEAALKLNVSSYRIDILQNHLDTEFFRPATQEERSRARALLNFPGEEPLFVTVANLRKVKDIATYIDSAALVKQKLPKAHFVIIGEGELRSELQSQIDRLGLDGNVRLAGLSEDVRPWLAAADIGILTSRSEGSSNAVLEYMATALPSVLSNIPANRELVEGIFFKTGNAGDLAAKLLSLWEARDQRIKLGKEYRSRALRYGVSAFRERAQGYYVRLVSRGDGN